eukprot:PhF_6_TR12282/c0_g1_i1/m.19493
MQEQKQLQQDKPKAVMAVDYKVKSYSWKNFLADTASACITAGIMVSVPVTIIDTSIIEGLRPDNKAAATTLITDKVKWVGKNFYRFWRLKGFYQMFVVYSGTYMVANWCQSFFDLKKSEPGVYKALATTCVNAPLTTWKDYCYAPMFGTPSNNRAFPVISLILFFVRDLLTMYFSFTMPKVLKNYFEGTIDPKLMYYGGSIGCPLFIQIFSTVMHIYAFDLYNRPSPNEQGETVKGSERVALLKKKYPTALFQRWGRIFVAYGCGTMVNTEVRFRLHSSIEDEKL